MKKYLIFDTHPDASVYKNLDCFLSKAGQNIFSTIEYAKEYKKWRLTWLDCYMLILEYDKYKHRIKS